MRYFSSISEKWMINKMLKQRVKKNQPKLKIMFVLN